MKSILWREAVRVPEDDILEPLDQPDLHILIITQRDTAKGSPGSGIHPGLRALLHSVKPNLKHPDPHK